MHLLQHAVSGKKSFISLVFKSQINAKSELKIMEDFFPPEMTYLKLSVSTRFPALMLL